MDYLDMKYEACLLMREIPLAKAWAKKAHKELTTNTRVNSDSLSERNRLCCRKYTNLKREARYLHLARSFMRGQEYKQVESSVRKGNEANPFSVYLSLLYVEDMSVTQADVEEWMA